MKRALELLRKLRWTGSRRPAPAAVEANCGVHWKEIRGPEDKNGWERQKGVAAWPVLHLRAARSVRYSKGIKICPGGSNQKKLPTEGPGTRPAAAARAACPLLVSWSSECIGLEYTVPLGVSRAGPEAACGRALGVAL